MLLKWFAKRAIGAFEKRWNYPSDYLREIVDEAGVGAVLPLQELAKVGRYRAGVPASVYWTANLTARIAADCGDCAQLSVAMATAAGVGAATIRAAVTGDRASMGADERLAFDLARSTIAREPADDVRSAILARFGRRGLVTLAYALVAAEAVPTFKYALGTAHACSRLRLDGRELSVREGGTQEPHSRPRHRSEDPTPS